MFKFLKKKIKKFENELESEIQSEIEKEEKKSVEKSEKKIVKPKEEIVDKKPEKREPVTKPDTYEKPKDEEIKETKKIETKEEIKKPSEEKEEEFIKVDKKINEAIHEKKSRSERRKEAFEKRKKREEEIDKQIERSLETELERTLKTRRSIEDVVKKDKKQKITISDEKLDDLLWDLEVGLLESDVAYSVIESIKKDIKEEIKHVTFDRSKIGEIVEQVLRNAISHVLESSDLDFDDFIINTKKPIVIMFVGVNGTGKTLSIAKMATYLKNKGYSSVMAAGDTFRAGAIEQLSIHADKVGVKIIKHGPGADPAAVAYDAIDHAEAKHKDVVLLDTAGRIQTNVNLMDEMAKIKRVAKPDLIIFVGDALSGNDAVEQAKRFNEIVGIDGVILTKVDTDAKGGSALSVAYTIGKPLLFIGMGQEYEDQIEFDADWMIKNIFGEE